jgi:hypothetical protein
MSLTFPNLILPTCLGWNFAKRSKFSTILQTPQSMRHPASATLQTSVIYELELTYEFLMNNGLTYSDDVAYLQGFYEACRGSFGWFTFDPSEFNLDVMSVVQGTTALRNGFFAVGDGSTKTFPLWRSTAVFGSGTVTLCELIQKVTLLGGIYRDGALVSSSEYTQTNFPAQVTFTSAPTSGVVLSWAGNYSYLCHFAEDTLDLDEFMYQLWELKSLKLETINL